MEKRRTPNQEFYVPKTNVPPNAGQIAAAKLIMKRHREGKGRVEITPKIRYLANYGDSF
ncbi:hypothetical protein [Corynebacterium sp. NML120713]|nr:hypothetical protein [Corynebacterium sp. NML120713]